MASTSPPIRFLRQDSTTSSIADMNDVDGGGVTAARRTEGKKKISYRVGIDFVAFFSSFLQPPPPFFFFLLDPNKPFFRSEFLIFLLAGKKCASCCCCFVCFFLFPSCHRWDAILVGGCVSVIEEKSFTIPRKEEEKKSASRKFTLRKNERKKKTKTRRRRHPQFF